MHRRFCHVVGVLTLASAAVPLLPADAPSTAPVNPGFEDGVLGEVPAGWVSRPSNAEFGYTIELTDVRPRAGARCARIAKPSAPDLRGFGNLMQSIDATPYCGKRVRLAAAIRAAVTGDGNQAQMWLRGRTSAVSRLLMHPDGISERCRAGNARPLDSGFDVQNKSSCRSSPSMT